MKTYFAAGCFWGIEESFRKMKGVIETSVGYANGHVEDPTYEMVCNGDTGHAETVEVEFDESIIPYEALLERFWQIHNPTTLNYQGLDRGTQYRSGIYFLNKEQEELALSQKNKLIKQGIKIVTEIVSLKNYYLAEEYHQKYVLKNH